MSSVCSRDGKAFVFGGIPMVADPSGALWWPDERALLVADLHLEKGSGLARKGVFLPPYDTRTTLARLSLAITRWQPVRVIALGDSFQDADALDRIGDGDRRMLDALTGAVDWVWISGNHETRRIPPRKDLPIGDESRRLMPMRAELSIGGITLRHEAGRDAGGECASPEISGHYHPKATIRIHGRRVTRRCFVTDGRTMILPSFGCYTGGLDVNAPPLRQRFPAGFDALLLGQREIQVFPSSVLAGSGHLA